MQYGVAWHGCGECQNNGTCNGNYVMVSMIVIVIVVVCLMMGCSKSRANDGVYDVVL